ncbi:phosphotransferase family protein [Paenibacillus donghaensis]|uniref:Aminoglycoside phosphotransferase domain-containing protein n=1 Tax=Paenibacillus donghaensis TaxID=414771 RepID=A0A2Z2KM76_9BACL|nr:phosphotransferase [Paenibacillus donghaensis]ASA21151.1 hypothetical protein B9T62_10340 [Paenibacillus donghaensis]
MESFTKSKLTEQQLVILTAAALGPEIGIINSRELTGGMFNAAYELELSDGRAVILKIAPPSGVELLTYEHNIMQAEVAALRLVHAAGKVPVPEVYAYDDSLQLYPSPFFFMEKIDGQPYNEVKEELSAETRASIETQLGIYNREINELRGDRFGYFDNTGKRNEQDWRTTFKGMILDILEDGQRLNAWLPAPVEEIKLEIDKYLPALDEVTVPRLVHWDLWNGNLFVKEGAISSIIDWERALWGDVLLEYYFRHFENSAAFHKGYGSEFTSPNEQRRIRLYDFYLDLILCIECYSRQYEDQDHRNWTQDNLQDSWERFINEA